MKRLLQAACSAVLVVASLAIPAHAQMGPLTQHGSTQPYSNYFTDPAGRAVVLTGSQTWNDFQPEDNNTGSTQLSLNNYLAFLQSHNQNSTILWHKDLPTFCNWGAGGTWKIGDNGIPWARSGTSGASDGHNKWDLNTFNATYFTNLSTWVSAMQSQGIYVVVELFDGLGLTNNRCGTSSPTGDGYPFTGVNNINGIDDGYTSGSSGTGSMTMGAPNAITNVQDAYVKKTIDTLNQYQNVIWEISEEAPDNSTFWQGHIISTIQTYEATKPLQHPILFPTLNVSGATDSTLFNSNAMSVAPLGSSASGYSGNIISTNACQGSGTPICKVQVNDSDHTYFNIPTDSQAQRVNFAWENFTQGAGGVYFMDPYLIFWATNSRNICGNASNGICTSVDTQWDLLRNNLGYIQEVASWVNLATMSSSASAASTGFALRSNTRSNGQFIVYAPTGGTFTVDISAQTGPIKVTWLNTSNGAVSQGAQVTAGSATQSFTSPFSSNASVLVLVGTGAPYTPTGLGWHDLGASTAIQPNGAGGAGDNCPSNTFGGFGYAFDSGCYNSMQAWSSCIADQFNLRAICTGGGHVDYSGNEVYGIQLGPTNQATRYNGPSQPCNFPNEACTNPTAPNARHTYGGLAYRQSTQTMFMIGGNLTSNTTPNTSVGAWSLNLNTFTQACAAGSNQTSSGCGSSGWTQISSNILTTFTNDHTDQPFTDTWNSTLNPVADDCTYVFFPAGGDFGKICGSTMSVIGGFIGGSQTNVNASIEQNSGIMIVAGQGELWGIQLSNGTKVDHSGSTGCGSFVGGGYPGIANDPVAARLGQDDILIYPGSGQSVGVLHTGGSNGATWSCSTETLGSSTPPTDAGNIGVFGRFRCFDLPEDACIYMPGTSSSPNNAHAWSYRRRQISTNNYTLRCNETGVIQCDPMDSQADTVPWFGAAAGGPGTGVLDDTNFPTGDLTFGATKLTVPANQTSPDMAGNWNKPWNQGFGQNSDFYVQYRYRIDSNFANYNWAAGAGGGGGHKISIFNFSTSNCNGIELTTQDLFQRGYPQMYSSCGAVPYNVDLGNGDFLYEQGNPIDGTTNTNSQYNCHRNFTSSTECAQIETPGTANPNQWMTFYYHVHVGTWGVANSTVQAWFAYEGGNLLPFLNYTGNALINCDNTPCNTDPSVFNHSYFLPYNTGYSGTGNPQASVWYCCQIISTQPILAPNGPIPSISPAVANPVISPASGNVPVVVSMSDTTGGATICYRTDGIAPTSSPVGTCGSGSITYSGMFTQSVAATVKAIGTEVGFSDSGVTTVQYLTGGPAPPTNLMAVPGI